MEQMEPMDNCIELELTLDQTLARGYRIDIGLSRGDSDVELGLPDGPGKVPLERERLLQLSIEPLRYGRYLAECLFSDPRARDMYRDARSQAETGGLPLRIRLEIPPDFPELQAICWETLANPDYSDAPLLTQENVHFSRIVRSADQRPVILQQSDRARALVVIAVPNDLERFKLDPIDAAAELARAKEGLGDVELEVLEPGNATLDRLVQRLRGGVEILYLVCHGALRDTPPQAGLWLENPEGGSHIVLGQELVTRIRELRRRPQLVVLVSCESAGHGASSGPSEQFVHALGPSLARDAGIPAVVAMQGKLTMDTAARFLPTFLAEFRKDAMPDRAMAVARSLVRDRPDAWMPLLLLRRKPGVYKVREPFRS